jgi:hypothetical protein
MTIVYNGVGHKEHVREYIRKEDLEATTPDLQTETTTGWEDFFFFNCLLISNIGNHPIYGFVEF